MGVEADERSSEGEWYGGFSKRLSAYVERLRLPIGTEPGNIAGTALAEVQYHLEVLERVLDRYRERRRTFVDLHQAFFKSLQQTEHPHELTAEEEENLAQRWTVQSELRQEIETFYLFARILLDKANPKGWQAPREPHPPGSLQRYGPTLRSTPTDLSGTSGSVSAVGVSLQAVDDRPVG